MVLYKTQEWRFPKNEELDCLYNKSNIVAIIKRKKINLDWGSMYIWIGDDRFPKAAFCSAVEGQRGR